MRGSDFARAMQVVWSLNGKRASHTCSCTELRSMLVSNQCTCKQASKQIQDPQACRPHVSPSQCVRPCCSMSTTTAMPRSADGPARPMRAGWWNLALGLHNREVIYMLLGQVYCSSFHVSGSTAKHAHHVHNAALLKPLEGFQGSLAQPSPAGQLLYRARG